MFEVKKYQCKCGQIFTDFYHVSRVNRFPGMPSNCPICGERISIENNKYNPRFYRTRVISRQDLATGLAGKP